MDKNVDDSNHQADSVKGKKDNKKTLQHNLSEKHRRDETRDAFEVLGSVFLQGKGLKMSRVKLLKEATQHIVSGQKMTAQFQRRIEELENQNFKLEQKVAQMEKMTTRNDHVHVVPVYSTGNASNAQAPNYAAASPMAMVMPYLPPAPALEVLFRPPGTHGQGPPDGLEDIDYETRDFSEFGFSSSAWMNT